MRKMMPGREKQSHFIDEQRGGRSVNEQRIKLENALFVMPKDARKPSRLALTLVLEESVPKVFRLICGYARGECTDAFPPRHTGD
jgi:hypothetical protein